MAFNNAEYLKTRYYKWKAEGKCGTCGRVRKTKICLKCRKKHYKVRTTKIINGLCYACGRERHENNKRCFYCILKDISLANLGSNMHFMEIWEKFLAQNSLCAYCGIHISIAFNAQLDHIQPRKRFPELESHLDNIQWLCVDCNRCKNAKTEEELYNFAKLIINKLDYKYGKRT